MQETGDHHHCVLAADDPGLPGLPHAGGEAGLQVHRPHLPGLHVRLHAGGRPQLPLPQPRPRPRHPVPGGGGGQLRAGGGASPLHTHGLSLHPEGQKSGSSILTNLQGSAGLRSDEGDQVLAPLHL